MLLVTSLFIGPFPCEWSPEDLPLRTIWQGKLRFHADLLGVLWPGPPCAGQHLSW